MRDGLLAKIRNLLGGSTFASREEVERAIGFRRLREQIWPQVDALDMPEEGIYYFLIDVYFDNGGIFALIASQGRLYRADVSINGDQATLGSLVSVTELFVPTVENRMTVTRVFQTEDGRWRWLSISNTAILNRVNEIDSRALFDSFIAHAEETGEYPYRTFLHQGETFRTGQADFIARDGYCYITSGTYDDDNVLALVEIAAFQNNPNYWGESIGYEPTQAPELLRVAEINIPVYRAGINTEISTCPEALASAWFTVPYTMEVQRMNSQVQEALNKLLEDSQVPDDQAEQILSRFASEVDRVNGHAQQPGVIARANFKKFLTRISDADDDATVTAKEVREVLDLLTDGDASVARAEEGEEVEVTEEQEGEFVIDDTVISAIVDQLQERGLVAPAESTLEIEFPEDVERAIETLAEQIEAIAAQTNTNFEEVTQRISAVEDELELEAEAAEDMPAVARKVIYRPSLDRDPDLPEEPASSSEAVQNGVAKLDYGYSTQK